MAQSTQNGDLFVNGTLTPKVFNPPAGCITDAAVLQDTGIQASKLEHQHEHVYSQLSTANAATDRRVLHVVQGTTGTLERFAVASVGAVTGTGNSVWDLYKNGSSILTGTITLDSGTAALTLKNASGFTSADLVAGDVLEVKVTSVSAGTGALATGLFALLVVREDAQ